SEVPIPGDEVLVGYLAAPGTADLSEISLTAELTGSGPGAGSLGHRGEVPLRLEMDQEFHYTDEGRTTGRVMNSLIRVYADFGTCPGPGHYEWQINGSTGLGEVSGTVDVAAAPPGQIG